MKNLKNIEVNGLKTYDIDGIKVSSEIKDFNYSDAEYVVESIKKSEMFEISDVRVDWNADGMLKAEYVATPPKFERIRRITGYLVGTMDRWNDAKRHEEAERVKHGVS